MSEQNLKSLEGKIDELIAFCAHLRHENKTLHEREANLLKERALLIEKNTTAKKRVEAVINRLKATQESV